MKISSPQADAFVSAPPDNIRAILIYGPDSGLVRERAESAVKAIAGAVSDPFNVAEFTPTALRDEPSRLTDEACALSMMGGRRVVRLRDANDNVIGATKDAIAAKSDALIILEAGDLTPRSKLRALFEQGDSTASIPCYIDEGAGLETLIRKTLLAENLSAAPGVISWIAANLGSDRLVSRRELEKLKLYMIGCSEVTIEDAQAIIGDAAAVTIDNVVFSTANGQLADLTVSLARARSEGISAVAILRAANRHFLRLEEASNFIAGGLDANQAMKKMRPPVFYKQKGAFNKQLQRWQRLLLIRARNELIQAEVEIKGGGTPEIAVCERVMMRLAVMAGAKVPS